MIRTEIGKALGRLERRFWPTAPVILIYHRVTDTQGDLWHIKTDPSLFEQQIVALKGVREVVSLSDLLAAQDAPRRSAKPLAAITFDDGYHDIFSCALPILERLDCPATVFVVSGMVDAPREFWWDELAFIFLSDLELPPQLSLPRRLGSPMTIATSDAAERLEACHRLRGRWRNLTPDELEAALANLRTWAGVERPARPQNRVMTSGEVAALKGSPLAVGAHTCRHPVLPSLGFARQLEEIAASRRACEAFVGEPVMHLAYPFGDFDGRSLRAARQAGFASAVTAIPSVVRPGADPLRLPRINPGSLSGEALVAALS